MKCGKCEFSCKSAKIDLKDDKNAYYCQFENKLTFHSGEEECRHPYEQYRESGACKYTDCNECDFRYQGCDEWVD